MAGYWAMGRPTRAIQPTRMMTMEMTQAKTGRSMKKRASMGCPGRINSSYWSAASGLRHPRHRDRGGLDGSTRADALDALDDDLLLRLDAGLDLAQAVVQAAETHHALLHGLAG